MCFELAYKMSIFCPCREQPPRCTLDDLAQALGQDHVQLGQGTPATAVHMVWPATHCSGWGQYVEPSDDACPPCCAPLQI